MTDAAPTRMRWALVGWIALMGAVSYLDRVNLSIAGPSIAAEYHLTDPQLGFVFSAFAIGYAVFQVGGGWMADRFGPRKILAAGALWWAVFTTLTAWVPAGFAAALVAFWLVRFLLGVGESVMYPSSNRWVANWVPVAERGLANGIIFAGVGTGAAITPAIITAIMIRYGWRTSFWTCAVGGLVAGLVWYWLARDAPSQHPWVNSAERRLIEDGLKSAAPAGGPKFPWRTMLSSKEVWGITLSYFSYGYVAYIFFTWFFSYLTKVRGLNLKSGSFYATLPFVAMAVGSAAGGLISDALSRQYGRRWGRCGVGAFGLGLAAVFVAFGSTVKGAGTASVILAGGAGALYLAQSSYWALSADLGGSSSGALSGFMNMGAQTGSAVTATLTPLIAAHFGWHAPFFVAAAICTAGAMAWLVVNPNRTLAPRKESEAGSQKSESR